MERTKRRAILKFRGDKVICGLVHVFVFLIYLFELLIILPRIYGSGFSSSAKLFHVTAGTCILINLLISYWKFMLTDPGSGNAILPSVLQKGWRYCWSCEANFPPRSYHCLRCETCVLARDHHCVVSSNCLGYKTRRYFLLMNFYFWIALLYANVLNMDFVWEIYHSFTMKSLVVMFMPAIAWFFGMAQGETFLMAMCTSFTMMTFLYATAVFLFHVKNTVRGRTTPEMKHGEGFVYDLGLVKNLEQAMGENWKIGWLCPLIPSRLPGDGIHFEQRDMPQHSGKTL